jgi:CBS domain-containing protein
MICPSCGQDNIAGVDACENCLTDLSSLDVPQGDSPIEDSLLREPVSALGPKEAVIVPPETRVKDVIASLQKHNIGCVLIGTAEKVEGIFSERDALLKIADREKRVALRPISEFMTTSPEMLEVDTPLVFALNRMALGDFRHLPLTEKGQLRGIISLRDLLAFLEKWHPDLMESRL